MTRLIAVRRYLAGTLRWFAHRILPQPASAAEPVPMAPWRAPDMPSWLAEELRAQAQFDAGLLPDDDAIEKYAYYSIPCDEETGRFYSEILQQVDSRDYTHVFLVPWLKPGGADRGILHHLNAVIESVPQANVLLISTEPATSEWRDRVPAGVRFIETGLMPTKVDFRKQVVAISRLLVQLQPGVVHLVNSRAGWEAIRQHGLAITQYSRLYASLFCDDMNGAGRPVGYARDYLRDTWHHFEKIFCDNSRYPKMWSRDLGVPAEAFSVLPFPYDGQVVERMPHEAGGEGAKLLWAGRFDRQKRPDVLLQIARRLPQFHFDVHGVSVLGPEDEAISSIRALPNVTINGPFARFGDIVDRSHLAYVMTTSWEGMPTILFDAAANGLPIIAPPVGGIPDFVAYDQLVGDPDDVDGYVAQIERYAREPQRVVEIRSSQYTTLRTERAWATFTRNLQNIPHYLDAHFGERR